MNNLAVATVESFRKNVQTEGLQIVKSVKTGATSIGLMKKKTFVDAYKKKNPDATNKQAVGAFDQYRSATLQQVTAQVATQMAAGNIIIERIKADGSGDLRNIQLVRRDRASQDRAGDALRRTSELTGIPVEELVRKAKERNKDVAIDIVSSTPAGDGDGAQTGPDATARENGQAGGRPPQVEQPLNTANAPQSVAAV